MQRPARAAGGWCCQRAVLRPHSRCRSGAARPGRERRVDKRAQARCRPAGDGGVGPRVGLVGNGLQHQRHVDHRSMQAGERVVRDDLAVHDRQARCTRAARVGHGPVPAAQPGGRREGDEVARRNGAQAAQQGRALQRGTGRGGQKVEAVARARDRQWHGHVGRGRHGHRARQQAARERAAKQRQHRRAAARLSHRGDARRIAAERPDVGAHPAQQQGLVGDAEVRARDLVQGEEAEHAQAVVERHQGNVVVGQQVVHRAVGRSEAVHQVAAVDPHQHGPQLRRRFQRPHEHVCAQAVLGLRVRRPRAVLALPARRPICRRIERRRRALGWVCMRPPRADPPVRNPPERRHRAGLRALRELPRAVQGRPARQHDAWRCATEGSAGGGRRRRHQPQQRDGEHEM